MTIECGCFDAMMDTIYELTKRGLQFKADVSLLKIYLTGGY